MPTVTAIEAAGASAISVDIDPDTYTINPQASHRPRASLWAGCGHERNHGIADGHQLLVIEELIETFEKRRR